MDINEQIVRAWLEVQGFLVKSRLKYKITTEKSAGWSDIDIVAYRLHDGRRVGVDISAWMTDNISLSYVKSPEHGAYYHKLFKCSSPEARAALRKEFGVHNDNQYELWLVISYLAPTQKEEVRAECLKHVDRVVEFPEIMRDLVDYIKEAPGPSQELEVLQTIRALVLCNLL